MSLLRVFLSLLFGFFVHHVCLAQLRYGNEWIVPSQSYAKISIVENGVYRVSYAELVNAGFALNIISPKNLQVFHHGREVAITVFGEADGRFDSTDFIEFYAEKNNGEQDSLVYYHTSRANPYQSLFSDETFYFLTVGQNSGKRVTVHPAIATTQVPEPYHLEQQITAYASQYSFNNSIGLLPPVQQSYFEEGEGWTGNYIVPDTIARFALAFKDRVKSTDVQPLLEFQLAGRSNVDHQLWYALGEGKPLDTVRIGAFSPKKLALSVPENAVQNEAFLLKTQTLKTGSYDWYSMTYVKLVYPQRFLLNGQRSKYFYLRPNANNQSVIQVPDWSTDYVMYSLTSRDNFAKIEGQNNQFVVPNTAAGRRLFVSNEVKKANGISVVTFPVLDPQAYTYLIATHNSLLESANQYAEYRSSAAGGNFKPLVIETQSLYDQFTFGERNPMAIRRFADFMLSGGSDKHLLLLGRGVSFPDVLKSSAAEDLVPTVGYPGSDALLTMGLAGLPDFVQAIPTGRLNVTTNQQVLNYLAKVKEVEQATPDEWQKRILHLNGGHGKGEISYLRSLVDQLRPVAEQPFMGAQVTTLSKRSIEEVEFVDISDQVNEGVSLISYTGHGSSNTLDFNFGYCSAPTSTIHNKGKYPLMFFNGCSINNLFYKYDPLSTDWLITPDKGALAVLAGSFWSYPSTTQEYAYTLYQKLFTDPASLSLTLGQIQQRVNLTLSPRSNDLTLRADMQQIILQGDPALHIFPLSKPDYSARSLFIQPQKIGTTIANNDSLTVNLIFSNVGRYVANQMVSVTLTKTYANGQLSTQRITVPVTTFRDTLLIPIKKELSLTKLSVVVDSDATIDELSEANNQLNLDLTDWSAIQANSIYPANALPDRVNPILSVGIDNKVIKNGDYVSANPVVQVGLIDDNILSMSQLTTIQAYLKSCDTCPFTALKPGTGSAVSPVSLLATYPLTNLAAGTYELLATGRDAAGNAAGQEYAITFKIAYATTPITWTIYPNPSQDWVQVNFTLVSETAPKSAKLVLMNTLGIPVDSQTLVPSVGENVVYLENFRLLSAGIYHATLQVFWEDGRQEVLTGKLVKR